MMKKNFRKAFNLSEVLIVMLIISVISIFWIRLTRTKLDFATKIQYYATVKNLNDIATILKKNGYNESGTVTFKFPDDGTKFCKYFTDNFNTIGTINCNTTSNVTSGTTDFNGKTPSFTLSNGAAVYNVANSMANLPPTSAFIAQNKTLDIKQNLNKLKHDFLYSNAAIAASYTRADPHATDSSNYTEWI